MARSDGLSEDGPFGLVGLGLGVEAAAEALMSFLLGMVGCLSIFLGAVEVL